MSETECRIYHNRDL